jgi:hypothetical protein
MYVNFTYDDQGILSMESPLRIYYTFQSFCRRFQGGDLVTIETQSENNFIYQELLMMHENSKYLILPIDTNLIFKFVFFFFFFTI